MPRLGSRRIAHIEKDSNWPKGTFVTHFGRSAKTYTNVIGSGEREITIYLN
jgi:hypothetical protein